MVRSTRTFSQTEITPILDKDRVRLLLSRGVPAQDMTTRRTLFTVDDSLVKMEVDIPGTPVKVITRAKQLKVLQTILENPLNGAYTLGISSFPSDARAKALAIHLMNVMIDAYKKHRRPGRSLPLWHRVFGGYSDPLRDKPVSEMPSALFIANIIPGSTPQKIEKVRDLLEKFSDIPRIVITAADPPIEVFANQLFYPMKAGVYIAPQNFVDQEKAR